MSFTTGSVGALVLLLAASLMTACATTGPSDVQEPEETETREQQALFDNPLFDGVYVVPGVDFSRYDALLVTELNLDQWHPEGRELPLRDLNANDRQFFRQQYSEAIVHFMVARGGYQLSLDPGRNVLRVDASLRQSVQPSLGESREAPRGTSVMLLTLELHDSATGELVATLSSRQPIDRSLNDRSSPVTAMQVRRAFAHWVQWFHQELDALRQP